MINQIFKALMEATLVAALIGLPLAIYFYQMTP